MSKINWMQLRENPFLIFKNYSPTIDEALHELFKIQKFHQTIDTKIKQSEFRINQLKDKIKRNSKDELGKYEKANNKAQHMNREAIFLFFSAILFLLFIPGAFLSVFISLFATLSLFTIALTVFNKQIEKESKKIIYKHIREEEDNISEYLKEISSLQNTYEQTASKISTNNFFDIKAQLMHCYHSDIPELNYAIQVIINESFPSDCGVSFSNKMDETKNILLEPTHVSKIKNYLSNIIEKKTADMIGSKILVASRYEEFNIAQEPPIFLDIESLESNKNY